MSTATGERLPVGFIANFAGQALNAIANFAFIPAYIGVLGIEAYGLIGLFAVVLTAASLLDAGMTPTLNREMASFRAGKRDGEEMRNLLFSVLVLCAAAVAVSILAGFLLAPFLAEQWLPPSRIEPVTAQHALLLMAVVATLRVVEGMLRGVLLGLQHPLIMNTVSSSAVLIRAAGVLAPLAIMPSVTTFFLWQAAVCLVAIGALIAVAFRKIGHFDTRLRFDGAALYRLRGFAGGIFATTMIALLLSQSDKIILVKLTSLSTFGYYAVAAAIASVLYQAVIPLSQTYYPHFTVQQANDAQRQLSDSYHQACQFVAVMIFSAGSFVFAFAPTLLLLWSNKSEMANSAGPLLRLLIIGAACHCAMYIPYMLQLAAGWSRLAVVVNSVAAALYLPLLWFEVKSFGAVGAAASWATCALLTLVATTFIMHRRLLRGEWTKWLWRDIAPPALSSASAAAFLHMVVPSTGGSFEKMIWLMVSAGLILALAMSTTEASRSLLMTLIRRGRRDEPTSTASKLTP